MKPADSTLNFPWGSLPVEQDILTNWDSYSSESIGQQRLRLIRQHLESDTIPLERYFPDAQRRAPQIAVHIILRPWRSEKIRKAAIQHLHGNYEIPLMLRTHYSKDAGELEMDNTKLADWVDYDEGFSAEAYWACLDDPEVFNFGEQWQKIFEIIPELTDGDFSAPGLPGHRLNFPPSDSEIYDMAYWRDTFKYYLRDDKEKFPWEWHKDPHLTIHRAARVLYRRWCTRHLIVVDKKAFATGHGRLIYLDSRRNIIRETRFDLNEKHSMSDIITDWLDVYGFPLMWEDSGVGEKYRVDGEFGQALYQLTEEDWADPELEPLAAALESFSIH
ncbi:hypothetical protein N7478_001640 [Penicillium angulare]|uniref:uncharacterized protein n=1 Tax=Penicillium angulare TaxID=116970 RepID=UPI00254255A0|nr:uncharacterized protein N7478_001640 [Penicillium angulare]KAJ5288610.1 hypothetical protein N7478_001640 [Penicillium angulare]